MVTIQLKCLSQASLDTIFKGLEVSIIFFDIKQLSLFGVQFPFKQHLFVCPFVG